ncbi:signal peptide peptidase-like [Salvia splendens]|uniref:signal peptide peptidase-like n=1 Tax=Salvia splendens TaxID=180675 RepID=UPI001C25D314|nr:signal peptide peptidase-like [Salvia splendens]XP_041996400.1 signal peptide peptidase-like [Salvia splendens]XP_041996401.1 signal peptide peptidase-like [Salvia splendens]XP_041996402.1 signal peptide peptidase-like [Salvia splendens]XP_041996403.1 signal peptide peptidase-like [Salvia splendens]XP_041996404.1 signal peptide peptidase-like [Salvia splendens]XP_041996405.1 signal peptide peptidase-like [Salvia splendens]XP_041996406.1 signal peptide peptidase-like [Salvia splendens]
MSSEHAMRFPLVRSAMLLSLFLLLTFLSKDLVNAVVTCYFFVLGIAALAATSYPKLKDSCPNHGIIMLLHGVSHIFGIFMFIYFFAALEVEFTKSQLLAFDESYSKAEETDENSNKKAD